MRGEFRILIALLALSLGLSEAQVAVPLQRLRTRPPPQLTDDAPLKQPRVFWQSGEYMDGDLTAASDHSLSLQSELFVDAIELQTSVLDRIEFPPPSAKGDLKGAFSVLLKNGDRLFADITALNDKGVVLKNDRHGELVIPLAMVQSLQRLKGGKVLYAGPTGALGWKHYGLRDAQGFPWTNGVRGALTTRVWNRTAMQEVELPQVFEVDVVLSSTGPLRFGVSLAQGTGSMQVPTIETWQDDLVIAQAEKFEPVLKLSDDDHSIGLRIFMNRTTDRLTLCDWSGKELAAFVCDPVTAFKQGVLIKNKGANLTIEQLVISTWDGTTIPQRDVKQGSAETMDSTTLSQGTAQPSPDGSGIVIGGAAISFDRLLSYEAGPDATDSAKIDPLKKPLAQMLQKAPENRVSVRYADGTTLGGELIGLVDQALQLKSALSSSPVLAKLEGMTRIVMGGGDGNVPALDQLDTLQIGSTTLHGQLEGTGDSKLRWRLPGAVQPVAVVRRADVEVRRPAPAGKPVQPAPALFFLKDGNVLGGKLDSVTPDEVKMHSEVAEVDRLEPSQLNAIHFNSRKIDSSGFSDAAWQVVKGTEKEVQRRTPDKVLLTGSGSWGNPGVLAGDELSFTMSMPSFWAALAVDLFVGDFEHRTKGAQLHLIYSGSDFWAVLESGENNSRSSEQLRNLTAKSIDMRLVFSENNVSVYANDMLLMNASLEQNMRKGSGIIFSPSTMWGNPTRDVEISNFKVRARPDFVQVPVVSDEARRNALTIPRFRRNSVPTHVLLAPNGDVLRGVIESATPASIKFQSGLDHIEVPVERVAAAVWLDKPREAPKPVSEGDKPVVPQTDPTVLENFAKDVASHWLVLQDGSRLAVKIDKFEKDRIKAWAPTLGEVKIPNEQLSVLKLSAISSSTAMLAYQGWKPEFAAEPVLPETGGQSSPLLGKPAPDFALPLLGGGEFNLKAEKGKVIVLDFWATWCGPCVMSMPEQLKAMEGFDPARVRFIAVNQGEQDAVVSKFIATRNWKMEVAMDSAQTIGLKYGVEGIPHCVVIGPDGNIVWVNTGYNPGESEKMASMIRKLLAPQ